MFQCLSQDRKRFLFAFEVPGSIAPTCCKGKVGMRRRPVRHRIFPDWSLPAKLLRLRTAGVKAIALWASSQAVLTRSL